MKKKLSLSLFIYKHRHTHEKDSLYDRKFSWGVSLQLLKVSNCRKVEMDVVCLEVAPPQLALDLILAM